MHGIFKITCYPSKGPNLRSTRFPKIRCKYKLHIMLFLRCNKYLNLWTSVYLESINLRPNFTMNRFQFPKGLKFQNFKGIREKWIPPTHKKNFQKVTTWLSMLFSGYCRHSVLINWQHTVSFDLPCYWEGFKSHSSLFSINIRLTQRQNIFSPYSNTQFESSCPCHLLSPTQPECLNFIPEQFPKYYRNGTQ